ncbi:unnamed protein product [Cyprideis torosa]|uniref:Uncharacterized protein n=1 Tax=Cyprideis torosa TaxID=163714 RepID=A0A7R8ZGQ7_9CRUS|nr:unnamed protein product [Cyprideis torosa]CAG0881976.1 unnamed protein product [Cyprideis torosa]
MAFGENRSGSDNPCVHSLDDGLDSMEYGCVKEFGESSVRTLGPLLWLRSVLESQLYDLGCGLYKHAGKVIFVGVLILSTLCVGLKSAVTVTDLEDLWVQEGGRLEEELDYAKVELGEGAGSVNQLVIQTPEDPDVNILYPQALLDHLDILSAATRVSVDVYDTTWQLKDLCYAPSAPAFELHFVDQIMENLFPCAVITPLDCFWEGSKLVGPDYPVKLPKLRKRQVEKVCFLPIERRRTKQLQKTVMWERKWLTQLRDYAGFTHGCQLDVTSPPEASPIFVSHRRAEGDPGRFPDCHPGGFLEASGHRFRLPGEALSGSLRPPVSPDLTQLQKGSFPIATLEDFLKRAGIGSGYQEKPCLDPFDPQCPPTSPNYRKGAPDVGAEVTGGCYGFATKYMHWDETFIVGGVEKNRTGHIVRARAFQTTVQLMGERELYDFHVDTFKVHNLGWSQEKAARVIRHWQRAFEQEVRELTEERKTETSHQFLLFSSSHLAELMKEYTQVSPLRIAIGCAAMAVYTLIALARRRVSSQAGLGISGVLLTCLAVAAGLGICAMLGIPFNASTTQIVPFLALGLGMDDLFFLCHTFRMLSPASSAGAHETLTMQERTGEALRRGGFSVIASSAPLIDLLSSWSKLHCLPALRQKQIQTLVLVFTLSLIAFGFSGPDVAYGTTTGSILRVDFLLPGERRDWTVWSALPPNQYGRARKINESYTHTQRERESGKEFEYPGERQQQLLYEFHAAFVSIPEIIKNDDGGVPPFWLGMFRDWLKGLQATFDREYQLGTISREGWKTNASSDAVMAYKLIVQTGHNSDPVDKTQIDTVRLVNDRGVIHPPAFYNYLSAWASNDAVAYSASQIREVCDEFKARGLPNFPSGIPFTFWEQYVGLRIWLAGGLLVGLVGTSVLIGLCTASLWSGLLSMALLSALLVSLWGSMATLLGLSLNAVPAVLLICSLGIASQAVIRILLKFLSTSGARGTRLDSCIHLLSIPLFHSSITTLLGVLMLTVANFDFVVRSQLTPPTSSTGLPDSRAFWRYKFYRAETSLWV